MDLRPHWVVLVRPAAVAAFGVALAVGIGVAFPNAPVTVVYVLAVLAGLPALWLLARWLAWRATSIVLTTDRFLRTSGVLVRRGEEVRLERVNQLSYNQTILGRVIGEGELVVEVGGETGAHRFEHVPRPAALQSLVTEQIAALARRSVPTTITDRTPPSGFSWPEVPDAMGKPPRPLLDRPGTTGPVSFRETRSIAERLATLQELHASGLVSDDEYAKKRAELLAEI